MPKRAAAAICSGSFDIHKQRLPILCGFNGLEVTVRIYFQLACRRIVEDENAIWMKLES